VIAGAASREEAERAVGYSFFISPATEADIFRNVAMHPRLAEAKLGQDGVQGLRLEASGTIGSGIVVGIHGRIVPPSIKRKQKSQRASNQLATGRILGRDAAPVRRAWSSAADNGKIESGLQSAWPFRLLTARFCACCALLEVDVCRGSLLFVEKRRGQQACYPS
jgi:hypothetical protein